jgi:hypothetical protein
MAVASETLGMMSDHRSEGGGKNAVLPPDTIAPEGGGENTGMFAPLIQAAIPTDDTSEGGGEIVDRIHDSSHLMGQWTTDVEQRPQPLTMQNGLAWLTRECDSLAAADMWSAVEEITRGVIAPKNGAGTKLAIQAWQTAMETREVSDLRRDTQDWQLNTVEFQRWNKFYDFEVDACSDPQGRNSQLPVFWSRNKSCLLQKWEGKTVWCNPPFQGSEITVSDILRHFKQARKRDPQTAACFILPYFHGAEWETELMSIEGLHCVYTYPPNSQLFYAPDGGNPKTKWPVQVWWCGPQEERVDASENVHAAQTRLKKASVSAPEA